MSTLLYQAMTLRREQSPTPAQEAEARTAAAAEGKPVADDKKKPADFVDVVAALVPAELIAVNALILGALSTKTEDASGAVTIRLDPSHPGLEKLCWIGLVVSAALLYILPHAYSSRKAGRRQIVDRLDLLRMLIPATAFWIWTMIQKGTLFDAVFTGWSTHARAIAGGFGGLALVAIAKLLSNGADEAEPTTAREPEPITARDAQPTTAREPEPITAREAQPTTAREPEPITAREAQPTTAREPEPITAREAQPTTVSEAEPRTEPERLPAHTAAAT